jgi:hypothetical protein
VALLERRGQVGLPLRAPAAELKPTPTVLYRCYLSREEWLAEMAVQGAQWLLADPQAVPAGVSSALDHTWLKAARDRPALYDLHTICDSLSAGQRQVYDQHWALVVGSLGAAQRGDRPHALGFPAGAGGTGTFGHV